MSRTQLILIVLILGGVAAAIYFLMGDADQKAIDSLIRDCAVAVVEREPDVIVEHLHDTFTFTAGNRTVTADELRTGAPRLLREAALDKLDIRTLEITRNGDVASARLTVVINSTNSPVNTPYPMKVELDLRRDEQDPKKWLFTRGILEAIQQ